MFRNFILIGLVVSFGFSTKTMAQEDIPVVESQPGFIAQEIEVEEALAQTNESTQELEIRTPGGHRYVFTMKPIGDVAERLYSTLKPKDIEKFQENRVFFLSRAAATLEKTRLTIGFASLAGKKLRNIFRKQDEGVHPLSTMNSRARGQDIVSDILLAIDQRLWEQSPVVARQNEYAVSASLGLTALGGSGKKVAGGSASLGLSIGYNTEHKYLVFEFYTDMSSLDRAITPTFILGLAPTIGFSLQDRTEGVSLNDGGYVFYPPGIPAYFGTASNSISMGMSSAILSFPPFIADAFSHINKRWRTPLLRIELTPVLKRIIRIKVPGFEKKGPMFQSVTNFYSEIQTRYQNWKERRSGKVRFPKFIIDECNDLLTKGEDKKSA